MTLQWHGPHYVTSRNHMGTARLGSIVAVSEDPLEFEAAGASHRPARFWTFGEAQGYLEGPGNRPTVTPEIWQKELNQ